MMRRAMQASLRWGSWTRCSSSEAQVKDEAVAKARKIAPFVGLMAGSFGAVVGVGGGVLIGPVISNYCPKLPQRVISGTSLAAVVTTGFVSGLVYKSYGSLDLTSSTVIALSAVVTAPLGSLVAHRLKSLELKRILAYWLIGVAPLIPLKNILLGRMASPEAIKGGETGVAVFRSLDFSDTGLALTGAVAGFASGLLGIGGGTIVTPALALFTSIEQSAVVGTSLVAMVLPSLVALWQHSKLGNVEWRMAGLLALGTCFGSLAASSVAVRAPEMVMEFLFSGGMLLLGLQTLRSLKR